MVHNGIEYGDMQLIAEAYDVLRTVGGLTNAELAERVRRRGTRASCSRFLIEITAQIFTQEGSTDTGKPTGRRDPRRGRHEGHRQVDGAAGARSSASPIPTIAASVEARVLSALQGRARGGVEAPARGRGPAPSCVDKKQLIDDVRARALRGEDLLATRRA